VPLQTHVAAIFAAFAGALTSNPNILGYDLLNEPWPGIDWNPCFSAPGCPEQDTRALDPYYARMASAVRAGDATHLLFGEPFVLFNFGQSETSIALPGGDPDGGLSFHMYTVEAAKEPEVVAAAVRWSAATGGALLCTEFGASSDTTTIDRQVNVLDRGLVPWLFWAYDENLIAHRDQPMSDANAVASTADALVRPHPFAVAGTPLSHSYDLASRELRFTYATSAPDGRRYPPRTETIFRVAPRSYPGGYAVRVSGGTVTSADNAAALVVVADAQSDTVSVTVSPAPAP
jgi:endoglycosylceramidase